jgi:hypothetical protein
MNGSGASCRLYAPSRQQFSPLAAHRIHESCARRRPPPRREAILGHEIFSPALSATPVAEHERIATSYDHHVFVEILNVQSGDRSLATPQKVQKVIWLPCARSKR